MNKPIMIVLLIVFLGLGVAAFSYMNSKRASMQPTTVSDLMMETDTKVMPETGKMKTTLADLVKLGKNYECTYDYSNESKSRLYGTVYVADAGTKMNGRFGMITEAGTEVKSNVIRDGDYMYIWSDAYPQGVKTKISPDDDKLFGDPAKNGTDQTKETLPSDQAMDFSCKDWNVDATLFIPPTTIKFVDMTAQLDQMMDSMQYSDESKCGMCDSLSGNAQDQCKAALGCK